MEILVFHSGPSLTACITAKAFQSEPTPPTPYVGVVVTPGDALGIEEIANSTCRVVKTREMARHFLRYLRLVVMSEVYVCSLARRSSKAIP